MSTNDNTSKKKRDTLHITKNPQFTKMIEEIMKVRGVASAAEVVRFCVSNYYFGDFRKEQFGYQAGAQTASGRLSRGQVKQKVEDDIARFEAMDDVAASAYLHEVGYFKPGEEDDGTFFVRKNAETGQRFLAFAYANGSSTRDAEDWAVLINNLRKVLRDRYTK